MALCQGKKPQDGLESLMDITLFDRHHLGQEQTYCLLCKAIHTLHDSFLIATYGHMLL